MRVYEHPTRAGLLGGVMNAQVRASSGSKPVVEYVGSDASEDRYGSIIDPAGWELDAYKRNPTVLFAHDYSRLPIGRALSVEKTRAGLKFTVEFAVKNAFARDVFELVRDGFLPGVSVGFIPKESKPINASTVPSTHAENVRYTRCELLELSVVPVPANRNALQNAYTAGRIKESTVLMAGHQFRGFLNGHDMFAMATPRTWEPSREAMARIEAIFMARRRSR